MTHTVSTVQVAYRDLLRTSVTDPNEERSQKNKEWIYDDLPASTIGPSEYPRISVLADNTSAQIVPHELGSTKERATVRIEVQIRVRKNVKYGDLTGHEFANSLAVQCSDAIRSDSGRSTLYTQADVFYSFLEQENTLFANDLVIKSLVFKNIMTR